MADIAKITRGMQNGAETIDNNFSKMNVEMKQTADTSVKMTGNQDISGVKNFKDGIKIKDLDVFPSYKIGSWFVENLDGNMYRLTTIISVDKGIDQPWGSLYLSAETQHPDLPAGFTKTGFTVSVSKTNNLMWSSVSGPSTFRLISGANTAGGTGREVIIQVMATK